MSSLDLSARTDAGQALAAWHRTLDQNPGDRAALRRAQDDVAAALVPATHRLIFALRQVESSTDGLRLPLVAAVLAHIRDGTDSMSLPQRLAQPAPGGSTPRFSELRMRRLLQAQARVDAATHLRRAIAQLKGNADLHSTAHALYWWNDRVRKEWSFAYFEKIAARGGQR